MAYTALETMRLTNKEHYGSDVGPAQPELHQTASGKNDLKSAALRFLHDRCEGLAFSQDKADEEQRNGTFLGKSMGEGQIPYNMQRDIDRLCLERELESFIDSGVAEDAYTIYYCYLSIFFGRYGSSKKMVELLSEFESNGSSLLMKHRDHYSHSVYVFALGLAIYETSSAFRDAFKTFYGKEDDDDCAVARFFLEYWGLTALFHDIGYPFELPFEQVLSYFEVERQERGKGSVFIAYRNVDTLTHLSEKSRKHFKSMYGRDFSSTNELFAFGVANRLGEAYNLTEEYLLDIFTRKPFNPDQFGYYMDHAWFSSARLYQELAEQEAFDGNALTSAHLDALTAILLHNSIFKFSVNYYADPKRCLPPLRMELHPLAYLLMYCDELQCWDRTAYGRNSRTELHPMAADFDFSDGAINAVYYYDKDEQKKIDAFSREYHAWELAGEKGAPPRLKAYSDMAEKEQRFTKDITKIVDTTLLPLTVTPSTRKVDRHKKHTYLSTSNFLHLYDFAISLNGRYTYEERLDEVTPSQLEREFDTLSLEYQLSNINQAKSFGRYLDAIRCFYTDRPVDYDMLTAFDASQTQVFAPMEHERWVLEHQGMAWTAGDAYEHLPLAEGESAKDLRERLRMHKLTLNPGFSHEEILAHYQQLSEEDQGKDWEPFNTMLELIKLFDGLRLYKLDSND